MSQSLTLETLLSQEQENRFAAFDFNTAWDIGRAIHDYAAEHNLAVAIEVYAFGQPLFLSALPGSCADNLEWRKRKRNTVLRMAHSSMYVGMSNEQGGQRMEQQPFIDPLEYCDHGGSFPLLTLAGTVFGAVTVSGLASDEDHALVVRAISQYLNNVK